MANLQQQPNSVDFNWDHFLQVETRHKQIYELLSAALADAEVVLKRKGRLSFAQLITPLFQGKGSDTCDIRQAKEAVRAIRRGLAETQNALETNQKELHISLHAWLTKHDPDYRLSYEIEDRYEGIIRAVEPLKKCFSTMLTHYGSTRNEIAVAYNKSTGELSGSARTSINRLMDSYENLLKEELNLADRLAELNARVERTAFREMMLPLFEIAVAPEFRPGMDYAELRDHFDRGAAQVAKVLERFSEYVEKIKNVDLDHNKIMHAYRLAEWEKHQFAREAALNAPKL